MRCEKNAVGRYLVIRIDALDGILTLCEVQVFAYKVPSKYINHAVLFFVVALRFAFLYPVRTQQNKSVFRSVMMVVCLPVCLSVCLPGSISVCLAVCLCLHVFVCYFV